MTEGDFGELNRHKQRGEISSHKISSFSSLDQNVFFGEWQYFTERYSNADGKSLCKTRADSVNLNLFPTRSALHARTNS